MIGSSKGTVDSRVVELSFQNQQFESGAKQSLSTLDRLKNALDFSKKNKVFDDIAQGVRKVNLNPLSSGIATVQAKFSALDVVAMRVLSNITDKALQTAESFVKSVSVDQVSAGWNKYAEKTSAVQTIMAATAKDFNDTGKQMEYVNGQLEKLNWFTDETSYNFLDMVNNIGKFTSNNISLDDSVTAMEGISNWAAISGANINEAGRAMYNLSQAMATGAVKLIDWKSIENANMATAEFKQTAIETAEKLGTLTKVEENLWKTTDKGTEVSVSKFNASLTEGWFTSEVLIDTLKNYGAFTDKLNETMEAIDYNITTSELLDYIGQFKDGTIDWKEAAKDMGVSAKDAKKMIKELGSEEYEFGMKAFKAAQEAKTFTEAIDSVKDAVSTGWMNTFEILFGDYEHAKVLWTDLANNLYEIFAESGNARNDLLKEAFDTASGIDKKLTVGELWVNALETGMTSLVDLFYVAQEAWSDIFPPITIKTIEGVVSAVYNGANAFSNFVKNSENLRSALRGVFAAFDIVKNVVGAVANGGFQILQTILHEFGIDLGNTAGSIGEFVVRLDKWINENNILSRSVSIVVKLVRVAAHTVKGWIDSFAALPGVSKHFNNFKNGFADAAKNLLPFIEGLETPIKNFHDRVNKLDKLSLKNIIKAFKIFKEEVIDYFLNFPGFQKLRDAFKEVAKDGKQAFDKLGNVIRVRFNEIRKSLNGTFAGKVLETVISFVTKFKDAFGKLKSGSGNIDLKSPFSAIRNAFEFLMSYLKKVDWGLIARIAVAFIPLSFIFKIVKKFADGDTLFDNFKAIFENIGEAIESASGVMKAQKISIIVNAVKGFALAIAILTACVFALSQLKPNVLWTSVGAMAALAAILVGAVTLANKLNDSAKGTVKIGAAMLLVALSVSVLVNALSKIQDLKTETLGRDLGILVALIGSLLLVSFVLSKLGKSSISIGVALLAFAKAIDLMVNTLSKLDSLDIKHPKQVAIGLLGIVSALIIVSKLASGSLGSGVGLLAISLAISLMVNTVKQLGQLSEDEIKKGLIAVTLFGAILVGLSFLAKKANGGIISSASLLIVAAAIGIISGIAVLLSKVDTDSLKKGGVAITAFGSILVALTAINAKAGGSVIKAASLIVVAVAIGIISGIAVLLSGVDTENLKKGAVAVAAFGLILDGISAMAAKAKTSISSAASLAIIAVAIGILAVIAKMLGQLEVDQLAKGIAAVTLLGVCLGFITKLISGMKIEPTSIISLGITLAAIAILALIVARLSDIDPAHLATAGAALGLVVGMFAVLTVAASMASSIGPQVLLMIVVVASLSAMLYILAQLPVDTVLPVAQALSLVLLAFSGALVVCALVGTMAGAAVAGIATLLGFIVAFGAVAIAIGALIDKFPVLEKFLDKGIDILVKIGEGLGRVVGAMMSGFSAEVVDQFASNVETLGQGLSKYQTAMDGIDGITVDGSAIAELAASIAGIAFGELIANIMDGYNVLLGGKSSVDQFATEITTLGEGLRAYSDALGGVTEVPVDGSAIAELAASIAGIAFTDLFTSIDNGLSKLLTGKTSLDRFKEEVKKLAESLKEFSVTLGSGYDSEKISSAVESLTSMVELGNAMSGLKLGGMFEESDFEKFKNGMKKLSEALLEFSTISIDPSAMSNISSASISITHAVTSLTGISLSGDMTNTGMVGKLKSNVEKLSEMLGGLSSVDVSGVERFKSSVQDIANTDLSGAMSNLSSTAVQGLTNSSGAMSDSGKELGGAVASGISDASGEMESAASAIARAASDKFSDFQNTFESKGRQISRWVADGILGNQESVTSALSAVISGAASSVSTDGLYAVGSALAAGLARGISDNTGPVKSAVEQLEALAERALKAKAKVKSPSRVFAVIGGYLVAGLVKGIRDNTIYAERAMSDATGQIIDSADGVAKTLHDLLSGDFDDEPVIRPVLDLSDIRSGAGQIGGILNSSPLGLSANFGAISDNSSAYRNRATADDILSALSIVGDEISNNTGGDTYNLNGITYDDGSNVADAVRTLIHAAKVGRRV